MPSSATCWAEAVGRLRERRPGLRFTVREGASAGIADLVRLPLRDAPPVHLCPTRRWDGRPSRSALIVRRLVRAEADEPAGREVSAAGGRPAPVS
ncbi:hypothetical protein AB0C21_17965 [Spirillospora sp. NPDC049024]